MNIVGGKCLVRNFWWTSFGGRMDSHYRSIALYSAATGFSQITMDFGWKAILDILQPRALPFFFSLPYTAYCSNKDKTVMVLQKRENRGFNFSPFRSKLHFEGRDVLELETTSADQGKGCSDSSGCHFKSLENHDDKKLKFQSFSLSCQTEVPFKMI